MNRRLITLEGLDGSGKGTQTQLLCNWLAENQVPYQHISFPDYKSPSSALVKLYLSGAFGKEPSAVNAYAASSFFAVDRFASYRTCWQETYQNGTMIVADRYTTSNIIYQLSKLSRAEWESYIEWEDDFEYGKLGLPRPNFTVYLDMPPVISQKLLSSRYDGNENKKDIHESNLAYLEACRESAAYAADKLGWTVINCADGGLLKPVETIHKEILELIPKEFLC